MHTSPVVILSIVFVVASCAQPQANVPPSSNKISEAAAANISTASPSPTPPVSSPTPAPAVQVNKDPKTLALAFYEFYVDGFPQIEDEGPAFAQFLTSRFFKEASKAEDYDPFLDAQDLDETWKGHVSAADPVINGDKATVDVLLNGKTFKWTMRVSLLMQKGVWKIDAISQAK